MLPALYAIVDPLATGRDPVTLGLALLEGGARCLQLRLKDTSARELVAVARALRAPTRAAGALMIVNDRPDVAAAADADGVHLGQDDVPVAVARAVLGDGRLVGVSTHDPSQVERAVRDGADYLGVGPIYATASKLGALPARGLALLHAVRPLTTLPLVAIGGIDADTAVAVRRAGADAVAMIGALVQADDVAAAVRTVLNRLS